MKRTSSEITVRGLALILAGVIALLVAGCAGGYYTTGAYYTPDYAPYYADYGYGGGPYYGYDPSYIGGFVITGGHHYHRYYGHHHFRHEYSHRGRHSGYAGGHARSNAHHGHHHHH
jgi:hypothetical protein